MGGQADFAAKLAGWLQQAGDIAMGWLLSPAAWSQFALLAVAGGTIAKYAIGAVVAVVVVVLLLVLLLS